MPEEKRYQIALSLVPKVGPVISRQLINHIGSAKDILNTSSGKLQKIEGVGPKLLELFRNTDSYLKRADSILNDSSKKDIEVLFYKDTHYPQRLHQVPDAPLVLYKKGNGDINVSKTIAIVGTRKATKYGNQITDQLVGEAKALGVQIISGLAYGIDVRSHKAALTNDLETFGVLACGLDSVYPTRHLSTAKEMQAKGGLISEYPIGTKADARFFPARNRIIAGLCDALIVVEAAKKGGALITANIAHSYEKPVYAVPGDLGNTYSEGCNDLIRTLKAQICTGFKDVVEGLNWDLVKEEKQKEKAKQIKQLEGSEAKVVKILFEHGQQMPLDQLSWKTQIPLNQLASVLLQLEFQGLIKPLPGSEYKLV